jgi:enoyl-CoA hydratase/carnithine racemase
MAEPPLLVARTDDVLTMTLNRPQRLNALNAALLDAFDAAFADIDGEVRAVVVRGAGRAFSSGHDLRAASEQGASVPQTPDEIAAGAERLHEITRRIRSCPAPVISQVHGYAIGGGAEIALSADLVIASQSAVFRFTETAVGLVVTNGFTALLPKAAGPEVAKEIILLGEPFSGEQARGWGLVNRVVADEDLEGEVSAVVALLRAKAPTALRLAKGLLDQGWAGTLEDAMRRETAATIEAALSADAQEAAAAFAERRAPRFVGR